MGKGEGTGSIQSAKQFADTPQGQAKRWGVEISAAKENQRKWWKDGEECVRRYLDQRKDNEPRSRLNLYHSNVDTELAVLYGQLPKVDVSRRFNDAEDDEARVGGEALERILNTDIQSEDDGFREALGEALQDYKMVGFGLVRLRYEMGEEQIVKGRAAIPPIVDPVTGAARGGADEVLDKVIRPDENIPTDYVHWRDFLWSPCRTWARCRWIAFRIEMTRDQMVKRFGEQIGKLVPLENPKLSDGDLGGDLKDAWSRASVWEVWSKEDRKVRWFVEGFDRILDVKDDPLQRDGFWPCPKPLIASPTTTKFMPRPDFMLARDLYDEIDEITYRIKNLERMARVSGGYNAAFPELARILEEAGEGNLVAIKGWNSLGEKGGINKQVDTLNELLVVIAKLIEVLSGRRTEKIALLFQVTGISDTVRGQSIGHATATEERLKAGFASTRLQTQQDVVARFASEHQTIRAEIISKHFDEQTILERSNILRTPDKDMAPQAIQLIKSDVWQYRVEVKPDSIALRDYASLKQERVETIGALTQIFQTLGPIAMQVPALGPFMFEIGKWLLSATKGSQQIEGVFDRVAAQAEQMANQPQQPPPPDPKLQTAQVKAGAEQFKAKADVASTMLDAKTKVAQHQMDMQKMQAEMVRDHQKNQAQMAAAVLRPPPGGSQ